MEEPDSSVFLTSGSVSFSCRASMLNIPPMLKEGAAGDACFFF